MNSYSDGTGQSISGTNAAGVTVAPWLADGMDTQLGVPGFQPDTNTFAITNDLGGQFSTIQAAINGTPAGHTITLSNGTYHESNILVNKSLTIEGASRGGVILGPSMVDTHDDASFGTGTSNGFVIQSSNVTIEQMTIDGNQNGTLAGTQNFRTAVLTDASAGTFGNIHLDHLSIADIYWKGVGFTSRTRAST